MHAHVGDVGSVPGLGRSPGGGNGNPHQYSCLENSMDRGGWWATVHGVAKSQKQLITHTHETKIPLQGNKNNEVVFIHEHPYLTITVSLKL